MDEDKEVFDILLEEATPYKWELYPKKHHLYKDDSNRLIIFPRDGGCICINPDKTWGGDIAPFCD